LRILNIEENGNLRVSRKSVGNWLDLLVTLLKKFELKMLVCLPEISDEPIVPGIDPFQVTPYFCGETNKVFNHLFNTRLAQIHPPAAQSWWRICGKFNSLGPSNWDILLEEKLMGWDHCIEIGQIRTSPSSRVLSSFRDESKAFELSILAGRKVGNRL